VGVDPKHHEWQNSHDAQDQQDFKRTRGLRIVAHCFPNSKKKLECFVSKGLDFCLLFGEIAGRVPLKKNIHHSEKLLMVGNIVRAIFFIF
jgi:hypothetical protein